MTHPLQQRGVRRISASAVRASKKVQLSRIGSRLRAFQRAIDEVRTLPLTFKNKFSHISIIDEASDFELGMQLEFLKAHHQIPLEENVDVALS